MNTPHDAVGWCERGVALESAGQFEAALASYDRAIGLSAQHVPAHFNRGNVLARLGQWAAAIASYDRALEMDSTLARGHSNRGVVQTAVGRPNDALESFDRAIALDQRHAPAYVGRANAYKELNRLDDALEDYGRAIDLQPDYAEAHFNRAIALLLGGDFDRGWREYEWRWRMPQGAFVARRAAFAGRPWLGTPSIAAKTIVIYSEKGLGDTLQFCRYVKEVAGLGAKVILQVQAPLVPLLEHLAGAAQVIAEETALPAFDCHCPLLSLPLAFGTRLDTIPAAASYLRADARRVAAWRARLQGPGAARPASDKLRVGLAWRGDPTNGDDRKRSIPFGDFLAQLPVGPQYVSLQRNLTDSEQQILEAQSRISVSVQELGLAETAAVCACLDVIISVDTSIAHLSAALGKRTWVLLPFNPDCRWLLGRDDSPWYPSVQLYRQRLMGDWTEVLARVAADLNRGWHPTEAKSGIPSAPKG